MNFKIILSPRAEKDLKKLERSVLLRIDRALLFLEKNPYPAKIKYLKDVKLAQFRIRVGDYRILYDIYSKKQIIYIIRIGHRKNIYK